MKNEIHTEVLIIGGGLQGLSSAIALLRNGYSVAVCEAQYCGRHASGVNAGGVRSLGRDLPEIPISLKARDEFWRQIGDILDDDCGFAEVGQIKIAEKEEDIIAAKARISLLKSHGFSHEKWIDRETVFELVPSMSRHVLGGIYVEHDGYALPFRLVTAFAHKVRELGGKLFENSPVTAIKYQQHWHVSTREQNFVSEVLVNCAGGWGAKLCSLIGITPPPEIPNGLMLMVTQRLAPFVRPVLGSFSRPLSFKQYPNGTVVIGGGLRCEHPIQGDFAPLEWDKLTRSAITVTDLFPHLNSINIIRSWSGIDGFTPDALPIVERDNERPLVHAFGFCGHGFELSPAIGGIVADLVEDNPSEFDLSAFKLNRFNAA